MSESALGERIKQARKRLGMSQADLARKARVSAAYLSELEAGHARRPSGDVLLRIASALDMTIAELLDEDVRPAPGEPEPEPSLLEFARRRKLGRSDVRMLASIRFRGDPPRTPERWEMIYNSIITSKVLDEA